MALSVGFSAPLIAAGAAAIKAGSDMESLTMGLRAVMKSSQATTDEMAKLREVAKLPGLGLEEAVKGTIRLQILGNSAAESRRIMGELGNALAVVGGGKADFSEVIRQLSQLGATGKVTKENLDPIIERIPQLAAIIKDKFGAEALGEPAKVFERLGISSQQFIRIITDELAKGERAGNTYKNSWENIEMAAKDAAAEFGKTLLPIAQRVLDEFLTPGIEKAKALATAFRDLPQPTQDWALAITAIATAAPLVLVALGTLIEKGTLVLGVLNKGIPILKGFASGLSLAGVAAGGAAVGVGLFMKWLIDHGGKPVDTTAEAIKRLNERVGTGTPVAFGAGTDAVMGYMRLVGQTTPEVEKQTTAHVAATSAVIAHAKAMDSAKLPSSDLLALFERFQKASQEKQKQISTLSEIMARYGVVTADAAYRAAKALDVLFVAYRQLSDAPDLGGITAGIKVPKFEAPKIDGTRWWEANPNIGDEGMMTRQQHKDITERFKDLGKTGKAAMQQVSTVITDLSRGITDVIFKGGKLSDMFKNVAQQAAQSITRLLIEGALKNLSNKLFEVGGLMGKVFGGGTGAVMSAVPGAAGSAASTVGAGASSAVGSVTSSLTGVVSAVGSVVSAVSSVIGNFQMAGMNKTLDLIEKEARYSQIHLLNILEKGNEYWPYMKSVWESLVRMEQLQMAVAGGASVVINLNGGGDPKVMLEGITRTLKQYGVIPRG